MEIEEATKILNDAGYYVIEMEVLERFVRSVMARQAASDEARHLSPDPRCHSDSSSFAPRCGPSKEIRKEADVLRPDEWR